MSPVFGDASFVAVFGLLLAMLACTEVGHRVGRRTGSDASRAVPTDVAGALLGMLGLLLGFTVSMAETRFDARKHLVIEEANAIGTALLRTELLPAPLDAQSRALLVGYLGGRIRWGEQAGDAVRQAELARTDAKIHEKLWRLATAAVAERPTATTALYVNALNQVIDLQAERAHVRANRIPHTVFALLAVIALIATFALAVSMGHSGKRSVSLHALALATWLVFLLIVDLDQPRRGWIQVSQEPLAALLASLSETGETAR
jgi:hypothetical protein